MEIKLISSKLFLYKYFARLSEKEKIRNLDYVRLDYMKEMIKKCLLNNNIIHSYMKIVTCAND